MWIDIYCFLDSWKLEPLLYLVFTLTFMFCSFSPDGVQAWMKWIILEAHQVNIDS